MFEILKTEGRARRGVFSSPHGTAQTPVFMNVGTSAAIKGGVSTVDLKELGCQIELSNTYHLHIRPGDRLIRDLGGIRKFFNWDRPVLTDSGGFQVFSLAKLRKITEEGVHFASHIDGTRIFMGPEESMRIQSNLASTVGLSKVLWQVSIIVSILGSNGMKTLRVVSSFTDLSVQIFLRILRNS